VGLLGVWIQADRPYTFRRGCNRCYDPRSRGIPRWSEMGHKFHPCPFWSDFGMNQLFDGSVLPVATSGFWDCFQLPESALVCCYRLCLLPVQAVWLLQFAARMNVNILLPSIDIWNFGSRYTIGIVTKEEFWLCQMTKAESSEFFLVFTFESAFGLMD